MFSAAAFQGRRGAFCPFANSCDCALRGDDLLTARRPEEQVAEGGLTVHLPPAGWYPDPEVSGFLRYFDGSTWTDRTRAGQYSQPSPQLDVGQQSLGYPGQDFRQDVGAPAAAEPQAAVEEESEPRAGSRSILKRIVLWALFTGFFLISCHNAYAVYAYRVYRGSAYTADLEIWDSVELAVFSALVVVLAIESKPFRRRVWQRRRTRG
jgi:hypothetical protein